jgi:uncharacterized membrane protein
LIMRFPMVYKAAAGIPGRTQPEHTLMNTLSTYRPHGGTEPRDIFAAALGVFSIGLGAGALYAPREIAKLIGVKYRPEIFYAAAAREILIGVGILGQRRKAPWLWTAAASALMDLGLLGAASKEGGADKERIQAAAGAVAGAFIASVACALQHSRDSRPIRVQKVIAIDRPAEDLYEFWRRFENLPRFMRHLESVRETGQNRSHWRAKGPAGTTVEWEAEIVDERPGELISWRSLAGSDIENAGSVRFERAPGGRGTFVRVTMEYQPPGGFFGASIAKLLGEEPEIQVQRDLYRFKQVMETGQVVTTEGQPAGRASSTSPTFDTDNARKV